MVYRNSSQSNCYASHSLLWFTEAQAGGLRGLQPLPTKKKREKTEIKENEKRGFKRERKLNQSFQEHVVISLRQPPDPAALRPLTVMASAFRPSRQPPLSQNPAYTPDLAMQVFLVKLSNEDV